MLYKIVFEMIMERYSNLEMTDMHLMYGLAMCSKVRRLYSEYFLNRRIYQIYQIRKHFKEYTDVYERLVASRQEVHTLIDRLIEILDLKSGSSIMLKEILKTVPEE